MQYRRSLTTSPLAPLGPAGPGGPRIPRGPGRPGAPATPGRPCATEEEKGIVNPLSFLLQELNWGFFRETCVSVVVLTAAPLAPGRPLAPGLPC